MQKMTETRKLIRRGLRILGEDAVLMGVEAYSHKPVGSFCQCFLGNAVGGLVGMDGCTWYSHEEDDYGQQALSEVVFNDKAGTVFGVSVADDDEQLHNYSQAMNPEMLAISDAYEAGNKELEEEIERFLGADVDTLLHTVYNTTRGAKDEDYNY